MKYRHIRGGDDAGIYRGMPLTGVAKPAFQIKIFVMKKSSAFEQLERRQQEVRIEDDLVKPWREKLRELRQHKRWDQNENLERCMAKIQKEAEDTYDGRSKAFKYYITFDDEKYAWQGRCMLVWYVAGKNMPRAMCEPITVTPTHLYLWEH